MNYCPLLHDVLTIPAASFWRRNMFICRVIFDKEWKKNLVRGRKIVGASSSVFYLPSLHFKFSLETKHHQTVFVSLDLCESKLSIGLKNEFIKVERKILHSSTSLNLFEIIFQFVSTSLLDEWLIDRCNGNVFALSRNKSWTKLLFCSQKKLNT